MSQVRILSPRPLILKGFRIITCPRFQVQKGHGSRNGLYGRLPFAKDDMGVLANRLGCNFISGLLCRPKPAGPDGIR